MRRITKRLISTDEDLLDFGLNLGFERDEIIQMKTNNPNSIETAAWCLACEWWKEGGQKYERKYLINKIKKAVLDLGKLELMGSIGEMIRENDRFHERNQTEIRYEDEVRGSLKPPVTNATASEPSAAIVIDSGPAAMTITYGTHPDVAKQVPARTDISRTQVPAIVDRRGSEVSDIADRPKTETCGRAIGARSKIPVRQNVPTTVHRDRTQIPAIADRIPDKVSRNRTHLPTAVLRDRNEIPAIADRVCARDSSGRVGNRDTVRIPLSWDRIEMRNLDITRSDTEAGRLLRQRAEANEIRTQEDENRGDLDTESSRLGKSLETVKESSLPADTIESEARERSRLLGEARGIVETQLSWLPDEVFESLTLPRETKGGTKREQFESPSSELQEDEMQRSWMEGATVADPKTNLSKVSLEDCTAIAIDGNNPAGASGQSSPDSGLFHMVKASGSCSSPRSSTSSIWDRDNHDVINWETGPLMNEQTSLVNDHKCNRGQNDEQTCPVNYQSKPLVNGQSKPVNNLSHKEGNIKDD